MFGLTLLAAAAAATPAIPAALRACGDRSQFAPYTITSPDGKAARGFNADFLAELLAAQGRTVRIELLPWKRCLSQVAAGAYDLILDVGSTPERQRDFHLVRSHYSVTPIVVYRLAQAIPPLREHNGLAHVKRCEMLGWDYSATGLPRIPDEMVSRPNTIEAAFSMLRAGRCQAMVYDLELLQGLAQLHGQEWMAGLGYHPIPWLPTYPMHLGVSRKLPYAKALLEQLDRGVEQMRRAGRPAALLQRYLPP